MQRIYCIGGTRVVGSKSFIDFSIRYLDIVNNSGISAQELETKWTSVTAITNGLDIKARVSAQSMVLKDGKTMLLSGGLNTDDNKLVHQTIAFDAETSSWTSYPDYNEPPFGIRQM